MMGMRVGRMGSEAFCPRVLLFSFVCSISYVFFALRAAVQGFGLTQAWFSKEVPDHVDSFDAIPRAGKDTT